MRLLSAVRRNDTAAARLLLAHGADTNLRDVPEKPRGVLQQIRYAFHLEPQAYLKRLTVLEMTLDTDFSKVPEIENVSLVEALLDAGAKVEDSHRRYRTPLMASNEGTLENIRFLLAHGAEVNVCDKDQNTPLHTAIRIAPPAVVEMLLAHGAKVDAVDKNGDTPLTASLLKSRRFDVVDILIRHGADVNHCNKAGQTPLSLAKLANSEENIKLIKAAGAK